jgi:hypothetical protein
LSTAAEIRDAYRRTFLSDAGGLNTPAEIVLTRLRALAGMDRADFVTGSDGHANTHAMALNLGMRQLALRFLAEIEQARKPAPKVDDGPDDPFD